MMINIFVGKSVFTYFTLLKAISYQLQLLDQTLGGNLTVKTQESYRMPRIKRQAEERRERRKRRERKEKRKERKGKKEKRRKEKGGQRLENQSGPRS